MPNVKRRVIRSVSDDVFKAALELRALVQGAFSDEETKDHIFKLIEGVEDAIHDYMTEEAKHG